MPTTPPDPSSRPATPSAATSVTVDRAADVVVLSVHGLLDDAAAHALRTVAATAAGSTRRLDLDLRGVEAFTPEGAAALVACRDLSAHLPEGLHYRTGRGRGRDALLAAYEGTVAPRE